MRARVVVLWAASVLWMGCDGEGSVEGDTDASIGFGDAQPQDAQPHEDASPDDAGDPTAPGTVLFTLPVMRTAHTNGHMMFQLVVEGGEADAVELYVDGSLLVRLVEPYTYTWDTRGTPQGEYEIEARAWRDGEVVSTDHRTLVVDRTPPTLQWHAPADGEDGVRLSDPIVLSFSEPVDPPTVNTGSIMVFSEGRRLPRSVALSPEGDTVSVRLSSGLPAFPADVTVRVDSGVSDRAGNPLANDVEFTFNMPEWVESADLGGVPGMHQPLRIAAGPDGELWLLFLERPEPAITGNDTLRVARHRDGVWEVLPGTPSRGLRIQTGELDLAFSADATPVVVLPLLATDEDPFQTALSRFDGSQWVGLDDGGRPEYWTEPTTRRALGVAPGGNVYLATATEDAGVRVALYDGETWSMVGEGWSAASSVALLMDDETPIVAFADNLDNPNFPWITVVVDHVVRWDGSAWQPEGVINQGLCTDLQLAKAPHGVVAFCSEGSGSWTRCNIHASWQQSTWHWAPVAQLTGHCRAAFSESDGYTAVTTEIVYSSTSGAATQGSYPPAFQSAASHPRAPKVHVSDATHGHRIVRPNWLVATDPVLEDPGPISDPSCDCDDGLDCTDDLCIDGECVHSPVHTRCAPGDYCAVGAGCTTGGSCRAPEDCGQPEPCVYGACIDGRCMYSIFDADGDGRPPASCGGMDCDDLDPTVFPGAPEVCNGIDNDCDGVPDSPNADDFCGDGFQCIGGACGCPATRLECSVHSGTICVDPLTHPSHCGVCGNVCTNNRECASGTCQCIDGFSPCSETVCRDLQNDRLNCGECGYRCGVGASCIEGTCECDEPGETRCTQTSTPYCADLASSTVDCGECGLRCLVSSTCDEGQCGVRGEARSAYVGNTHISTGNTVHDPSLAMDPDGHFIVTAEAPSTFYHYSSEHHREHLSSSGYFVLKADPPHTPQWVQRLWHTGSPARVLTDAEGDVYVVGNFRAWSITIDDTTIPGSSNSGRATGLILKLSGEDGSLLWHEVFPARDISPVAPADASDVAIDDDGNLVVIGTLPVLHDLGGGDLDPADGTGVVYRFAPDGSHLASWRLDDTPSHVSVAPDGNVIVAGTHTVYRFGVDGDLLADFTLPYPIHALAALDDDVLVSVGNVPVARYTWEGEQVWPAAAPMSGWKTTHRIVVAQDGVYLSGGASSSLDIAGDVLEVSGQVGFVARVSRDGAYDAGGTFWTSRTISGRGTASGLVVLGDGQVVAALKGAEHLVLNQQTSLNVFGTGTYVAQFEFAP
jgi:hypothetical protein